MLKNQPLWPGCAIVQEEIYNSKTYPGQAELNIAYKALTLNM